MLENFQSFGQLFEKLSRFKCRLRDSAQFRHFYPRFTSINQHFFSYDLRNYWADFRETFLRR